MLADALEAYGRPGAPGAGLGSSPVDPSQADGVGSAADARPILLSASLPASEALRSTLASIPPGPFMAEPPADSGASPRADGSGANAGAGTLYAMGSPANFDPPWQAMADQYTQTPAKPQAPSPPPSSAAPSPRQTVIDPIPNFDQTGRNAWRAANDPIFLDAVNRFNAANGYRPGDAGYWLADLLKAQAMKESGGDKHAFLTDPLQVNNVRDWEAHKKPVAGLEKGQAMTPQTSADAALKWLQYKGWVHDDTGKALRYRGDYRALRRYNGHDPRYAERVEGLFNAARQARRGK
jgi:hypothetical protein